MAAAKTLFTDTDDYTKAAGAPGLVNLKAVEPSLSFVTVASTVTNGVSVSVNAANDKIGLARISGSGLCFEIADASTGAAAGTTYGTQTTPATCTGLNALGVTFTTATLAVW